jgi:type I restriction enzyme R subunit
MVPPPPRHPEQRARVQIDAMLNAAGWDIQDRQDLNLAAAAGVAVREFRTRGGPADYLLFLRNQLVGVIEAKKAGVTLAGVEAQTRDYAEKVSNRPAGARAPAALPLREHRHRDLVYQRPRPRAAGAPRLLLPSPRDPARLARRRAQPPHAGTRRPAAPDAAGSHAPHPALNTAGMWPAQIRAVENLEASFRDGKPRALIQMATGSGKTFTAIAALYRLIKEGGARRVLFLVDRGNLGRRRSRNSRRTRPRTTGESSPSSTTSST